METSAFGGEALLITGGTGSAEPSNEQAVFRVAPPLPSRAVSLGELAALVRSFKDSRRSLLLPDFSEPFVRVLYGTYLSYLPTTGFGYGLGIKSAPRGGLAEFVKQPATGQIFVSRTKPGVTRGNHFHHTTVEQFLVVEGEGLIRFRGVEDDQTVEHRARGHEFRVVDIPTGYTHSMKNVGPSDMVTMFWSSPVFHPSQPDTIFLRVINEGKPT